MIKNKKQNDKSTETKWIMTDIGLFPVVEDRIDINCTNNCKKCTSKDICKNRKK